jgi:acetate kinase
LFDTAFFQTLPESAFVYPIPFEWQAQYGVRRFGFHGISHAYVSARARELAPGHAARIVSCHLGNGCSVAAIRDGMAVATSMGFTPLEGLMMGTRSGSIDPGLMLYLMMEHRMPPEALQETLNHKSGLLGISGVSADYRCVKSAADGGNARARLALAMYANRIRAEIAAEATAMGGLDTLVFTAGVGEHASDLRADVCARLRFMGVAVDAKKNANVQPDDDIAAPEASVRVLVIHTREEQYIAHEIVKALAAS